LQRHVGFGSGKIEDPPEKRYGRIANPTVHIGLNELRKVVNALIKPLVLLLSLPAVVLTLGLFTWVVNAAMLGLTAAFTDYLAVDGLWSALGGSLVVSGVSALLSRYTGEQRAR
jgi:uncharacterized membrane protein YvlD (DUF360 family)